MKSSNRYRCWVMAVVVVIAVLATVGLPRAQASHTSAGLAAQAAVSAVTGDYMLDFYYRVRGIDGQESIWVMQPYEASDFKKEKNRQYKQAVKTMVERTSTGLAPWTLIPANDKLFARIDVLKNVCEYLEKNLS